MKNLFHLVIKRQIQYTTVKKNSEKEKDMAEFYFLKNQTGKSDITYFDIPFSKNKKVTNGLLN